MREKNTRVPVPPDIDDYDSREAYLLGAQVMSDLVVNAMHGLRPELEDTESEDGDEDVCSDCGSRLLASMGHDGLVCPDCDL